MLAARDLPDAERCLAEATADLRIPPRPEIAEQVSVVGALATKARFLALASDPAALPLARDAAKVAGQLAYPPLVAHAQLALGAALESDPKSETFDAYRVASEAALQAGDDLAFVEAFARDLFVVSQRREARGAVLASTLPFVATIAKRTGEAGRFARALLYNNAGTASLAAGDTATALAWLRQARAEPPPQTGGAELWAILGNLAMVSPRAERDVLFREERARIESTLGADHPFALQVRLRAAMFVEHADEAAARLRELCAAYVRLHPHREDRIGMCHYELAWFAAERGDTSEAQRAYAIAVAHPAGTPRRTTTAKAQVARLAGDLPTAIRIAETVATGAATAPTWWERFAAVDALLVVATAEETRGSPAAAITALRRARAVLEDRELNLQAIHIQRRRARVLALLALATRDRALGDEALVWYRAAGGYEPLVRQLMDIR